MATASNPSPPPPHHSVPPSVIGAANVAPNRAVASSPWVQIVRGTESVVTAANAAAGTAANVATVVLPSSPSPPPSSGGIPDQTPDAFSDSADVKPLHEVGNGSSSSSASNVNAVVTEVQSSENGGSSNASKKPVWNRPSPSHAEAEVSPVMGAVSWPALSESTKASSKSFSPESHKNLLDGSTSVSQGTGMFPPFSHRQGNGSDGNLNSNPNHVITTRQRPNRRVNGGGSDNSSNNISSNGELALELAPNSAGKSDLSTGEPSVKENMHLEGGGQRAGSALQSHGGGDHQQRNTYRRGSSGPYPRDGSQHHSHGGRRDQDRGYQDWNPHRNFGGRDAQMQHQRGSSRPFFRGPSHANMSYIPPPPVAFRPPFVAPMIYPGPDVPSPVFYAPPPHLDAFRAVPLVAPIGPVYFPFADPHLHMKIVKQIEYYFSNDNIVKDTYLRQNMDEQGWVPIKLIAGFNLVYQLTDDIQQILAALQSSTLLEVEGEKVRRRDDWSNWIIPQSAQQSGGSSPQSTHNSGNGKLAEHLQSLALNDSSIPSRSSSGELSSR